MHTHLYIGADISATPITHQPISAIPNYGVHTLTWDRPLSSRSYTYNSRSYKFCYPASSHCHPPPTGVSMVICYRVADPPPPPPEEQSHRDFMYLMHLNYIYTNICQYIVPNLQCKIISSRFSVLIVVQVLARENGLLYVSILSYIRYEAV